MKDNPDYTPSDMETDSNEISSDIVIQREICGLQNQCGMKNIQLEHKRIVLILTNIPEHPNSLCNPGKKTRTNK